MAWRFGALVDGRLVSAGKMFGEAGDDERELNLQSAHEGVAIAQRAQWPEGAGRVENAWQIDLCR
jgi:hypothetical protein